MKRSFQELLQNDGPVILPAAHDALCARLIERAGFDAYSIGGAAVSAVQLALPDIGLQSFGEYVDNIERIMQGSALPVFLDGENGFGDVKGVVRTIAQMERMGIGGMAIEDLRLPPRLGRPPALVAIDEISRKLEAGLQAKPYFRGAGRSIPLSWRQESKRASGSVQP